MFLFFIVAKRKKTAKSRSHSKNFKTNDTEFCRSEIQASMCTVLMYLTQLTKHDKNARLKCFTDANFQNHIAINIIDWKAVIRMLKVLV